MEWINENSGILVLIGTILTVALLAFSIFLMISLRNRLAVQRLKILGLFSVDFDTRERYAEITVANKSLNEVGISELGIQNGITNFDLTALYKEKSGMLPDSRVVIEQRSAITLRLSTDELLKALLFNEKQPLRKLRFYAIDLTGTLYRGNLKAVKKLLATVLNEQKKGIVYEPQLPVSEETAPSPIIETEPQPYAPAPQAYEPAPQTIEPVQPSSEAPEEVAAAEEETQA